MKVVDRCDRSGNNGLILKRNADDYQAKLNQCSYQASYLAKERGKEKKGKGSRLVSGTRLPKSKITK